jgi:gamma-glutamylcyclotransferase (GGCT)/AIG2-like uncharacterized protein YtfP
MGSSRDRHEPEWLFVYGTLMPGHLRWPMLRSAVGSAAPAAVAGRLFDTGLGYPAAVFPGDDARDGAETDDLVSGWELRLTRSEPTLAMLDRVEGPGYRRVVCTTTADRDVFTYEWIGPTAGLHRLVRPWSTDQER